MKIAIGAYACGPGSGSEPGAGWEWARAAALRHDVWVFTESCWIDSIRAALREEPELRMVPIAVPVPDRLAWREDFAKGERTRYVAWQYYLRRTVRATHARVGFDVAHHVTYASDWMPSGVAGLPGVPFIWGPVGGTSPIPLRFWRELGRRQLAVEVARGMISAAGRVAFGTPLSRRASSMLAVNNDVAKRFRAVSPRVEPNIALHLDQILAPAHETADGQPTDAARSPFVGGPTDGMRRAVFAGRLLPWKGIRLAVAALARKEAADWCLDIYGDGPDTDAIRAASERHGVSDRVILHGLRPRSEVLAALRACDTLLFPSMHDSAGWVVAETLALGRPVVCLDIGGPAMLVGQTRGIQVPARGDVVGKLAKALARVPATVENDRRFDVERLPDLLDEIYTKAVS
jgi:glycosyltransferase involved in cell wall biosynthesis